jgi:hypothetical protein
VPVFRLAQVALEAEAMRLRQKARRTIVRILLGCVAVMLLLGAMVFGHIAVWYWLRESLTRQYVALIFTGADLLLAVILGLLAARSKPGQVEVEALLVRRRALVDAAESLTISALVLRLVETFVRSRRRR